MNKHNAQKNPGQHQSADRDKRNAARLQRCARSANDCHGSGLRYRVSGYPRRIREGFNKFRPVNLPIVWAQLTSSNHRFTQFFDSGAILKRHTTGFPIADGTYRDVKALSKNFTPTDHARNCVDRVLTSHLVDLDCFHGLTLTRFVFTDQHHVMTLNVFNLTS